MAGDWIKMRVDLSCDPRVIGIAAAVELEEDTIVGKLHRFWSWADQHTADGNAPCVTKMWIDRYVSVTGFADALISVGWLTVSENGVAIPDFERHNGESGKRRSLTAKRAARHRHESNANRNANRNAPCVTKSAPREEKRREDKDTLSSTEPEKPGITPATLFDEWVALTKSKHMPTPRTLTKERREKLRTRMASDGWVEMFRESFGKVPIKNDDRFTWQPDLDWLIANDTNVAKLVEGRYDDKPPTLFDKPKKNPPICTATGWKEQDE